MENLVDAGAQLNVQNNAKAAPIHKAANEGHLSCVQKLVRSGADIDVQDQKGNTALVSTFTKHETIDEQK